MCLCCFGPRDGHAVYFLFRGVQAVTVQMELDEEVEISTKLYVDGICCPSEVPLITNILTKLPGVLRVRFYF